MNLLDRLILAVDPKAGLQRLRARAAAAGVRLAYEGAKTGRRTEGWITAGGSGNAELGGDIATLRNRSRSLIRDNHYAANACEQWAVYSVSYGITPQPKASSQAMNQFYAERWEEFSRQCSADGLSHFPAMQRLIAKTEFESGEVLLRRRFRRRSDRNPVPLQVQVLEPDYLDHQKTGPIHGTSGYIIQGVEFDGIGRRVAYWLFPQHPGEVTTISQRGLASERVPAEDIIHVYDMRRPGMVRGVPRLAPVLLRMRDLDDYEDAYLMLQKVQACLAAFVEQPDGDALPINKSTTDASTGIRLEMIEPATINYLKPGEKITFSSPQGSAVYGEYKRSIVRDLACGMGFPYEILSGDSSQNNYSSSRGGKVGFIQLVETYRWDVLIPAFDRIWQWWQEAGVVAGVLSGSVAVEWAPPPIPILDREVEAKADLIELQNGALTWPQLVSRQGYDPEKQISEITTWKERLEAAGVQIGGVKQNANNESPAPAA
jgi:lambda family phage portal protein